MLRWVATPFVLFPQYPAVGGQHLAIRLLGAGEIALVLQGGGEVEQALRDARVGVAEERSPHFQRFPIEAFGSGDVTLGMEHAPEGVQADGHVRMGRRCDRALIGQGLAQEGFRRIELAPLECDPAELGADGGRLGMGRTERADARREGVLEDSAPAATLPA